jgi:integrase
MSVEYLTPPRKYHSYHLLRARLKPKTKEDYRRAVARFVHWCRHENRIIDTLPQLDSALLDYFEWCYRSRLSKQLAVNTLSGIIWYRREAKGHLPYAAEAIAGWQTLAPAVQRPPITWPVVCVIAVSMAKRGMLAAAIGTLLGFDCFLRVSELCSLTTADIIDAATSATDRSWRYSIALRLRYTKTGENQSVPIINPGVARLLRQLVRCRQMQGGDTRLVQLNAAQYRYRFKQTCKVLGLDLTFTPHSLRHGGATHYYMQCMSMETVQTRGRWESLKTCRRYVQTAQALIASTRVPQHLTEAGRVLATDPWQAIITALPQRHTDVGRRG